MADYKDVKYNVDYSETSGAGGLVKITSNLIKLYRKSFTPISLPLRIFQHLRI